MNSNDVSLLPDSDYVSPGFAVVRPDHAFPELIVGDTAVPRWHWLRRWVEHNWYTDRRNPDVGFASRDEASILYNAALLMKGRPCLEIGCWRGWSAVHLALGCGAGAGGTLDVIDPVFADQDFAVGVRRSCEAVGVSAGVSLHTGFSPDMVELLAAESGRKWSLVFIDGDHEGGAPRRDAEVVMRYAADTCIVLFHDLASPFVAAGLDAMRKAGWHTMVYQTMQIMGVAWRGDIEPPHHIPDPTIFWTLPEHLAGYPVSGWQRPTLSKDGGWFPGMTMRDRRDAAMIRAQAAEDFGTTLLLQKEDFTKQLAANKQRTAAAEAVNAVISLLPRRAAQVADNALALTSGWANAMPRVDMLAHLLTGNRVLLGLLRRRPEARLAAVRKLAVSLHQFVPEEALHRILRRRVLFGLLCRNRSHRQGIVVIEILRTLARQRSRDVEALRTALAPIGNAAGQQSLDVVTARRMLGRLDWLIGLFDPALPEGYRPVVPGSAASVSRLADSARENVLLVVHETSRTGAPILGWNLALHLSRHYNVFTVMIGDGPLTPSFAKISIETHGPFPPEHRTPAALEQHLRPMLAANVFRYAIINSCESRPMIGVCAAHGIPTVMLMHEFAALVHSAQSLRDAMDAVDEMVFPAAIVARSAYEVHPALRDRQVRILPQGMCVLPEAKVAPDEPADPVVGELARARAAGGFVVLGAGTVEYRKGVDLFLAAAMAVKRDAPELGIRFLWVGHGYQPDKDKVYSSYLREQIARSGLSGSVTLLDAVADLDPIYGITDTFLLTSRLDPLPNVSIDAACRGIPVVCFRDASGTADVLLSDPGTASGVVDYLDTSQAAAKIVGFARDRASHRRMSAATSALAGNVFDMGRYAAALDALGRGAVRGAPVKQGAGL